MAKDSDKTSGRFVSTSHQGEGGIDRRAWKAPTGVAPAAPGGHPARRRGGYLLLPIVLMLAVLAATIYLIGVQGGVGVNRLAAEGEAELAEYVAESGLTLARWNAENNGCGGDFSSGLVSFGGHTFEASMVAGGTTSTTTAAADQDAWIRSDDPDKVNGDGGDLHVRFESGNVESVLMRFDLAGLSPGTRINSAMARFGVEGDGEFPEGSLTAHFVTQDWEESSVTWSSFGNEFSPAVLGTILPEENGGGDVTLNLTSAVQAWVNGQPNFGILIQSVGEGIHGKLTSRSGGGTSPSLEIVVGGGAASPASLASTGTLASGTTRSRVAPAFPARQPTSWVHAQPSPVEIEDTYLDSGADDSNFGGADTLRVREDDQHTMIRFPLENRVPASAKILEARIELYASSIAKEGEIEVYGVTRDWIEGTCDGGSCSDGATWDNWDGGTRFFPQRVTVDADPSGSSQATGGGGWVSFDLTSLVSDWRAGVRPNLGFQLRSVDATATFSSAEEGDVSFHPRVIIAYACECGAVCLAPAGTAQILLVVSDAGSPADLDVAKQSLFEAWGYTVTLLEDDANAAAFLSAQSTSDVVYLSATVDQSQVADWDFSSAPLGLVNENLNLVDELGLGTAGLASTGKSIEVLDTSHEITSPFNLGSVELFEAEMTGSSLSGALAIGGTGPLARWNGTSALIAVEGGGELGSGTLAAGRRVHLPFAGSTAFEMDLLTGDARVLLHRSLEWAASGDSVLTGGASIWMATDSDVSDSGAPSLDDWTSAQAISFGGVALALEPDTTAGNFAVEFDLDEFTGGAALDALHWVSRDLTVGSANAIPLQRGDLLLSTVAGEDLESDNKLSVNDEDVFLFRPKALDDYTSGTFAMVLDGSRIHSQADTVGVTLVEARTVVGDGVLEAGDFLLVTTSGGGVMHFETSDVGQNTTSGTPWTFLSSSALEIDGLISGIDLVEEDTALGGEILVGGAVLLALEDDHKSGVADNRLQVESSDVFSLAMKTLGDSSEADATLLFDGSDVGLDSGDEELFAFSLAGITPGETDSLGPVAYWTFDEGAGSLAADSVGGHDGDVTGASWTLGEVEGALEYRGGTDVVRVPHAEELALTEALTVSAWINPSSVAGAYRPILSKGTSGTTQDYWFGIWENQLLFSVKDGGSYYETFAAVGLESDRWVHVAATFDGASGRVELCLDGGVVSSGTISGAPPAGTEDLLIGRSAAGDVWLGVLDEVRLYDRVLSSGELSAVAVRSPDGGGGTDLPPPGTASCSVSHDFEDRDASGGSVTDGGPAWRTDWEEVGESDGLASGDVRWQGWGEGTNSALRLQDNQNGGEGVERGVDLSGSFTSAQLRFRYWRDRLDNADDSVSVQVSSDGGANWDELVEIAGPDNDAEGSPQEFSSDVLKWASGGTLIRFVTSPDMGDTDRFYLDNVSIDLVGSGCP